MKQFIAHITLLVDDYDIAIDYYTRILNFVLVEDTRLSDTKRWVLVAPPGSMECSLLLAKAVGEQQQLQIGNQSAGRVFLFLVTDNLNRDYGNLVRKGVRIVREPRSESYGTVLVFQDMYGNLWDLIQRAMPNLPD